MGFKKFPRPLRLKRRNGGFEMIIIPILIILGACALTVIISEKQFGKCILPTMIIITMLIYFSQMLFRTFTIGYIAIVAYSLSCIPAYIFIGRNKRKVFLQNFSSCGFWVFLIIVAFFYLLNRENFITTDWDEVMHWGVFVKEMMRTGHWYFESPRNVPLCEYPPFLQIWEMFVCKFSVGHFQSNICHYALHVFEFSAIALPVVEELKLQKIEGMHNYLKQMLAVVLVAAFFIIIVKTFDCQGVISKLHADYALMIIYGRCLCQIWESKKDGFVWGNVNLILDLTALILIKQIGVFLCFTVLILYWIIFIKIQPYSKRKKMAGVLASALLPFSVYAMWSFNVNHHTVTYMYRNHFNTSVEGIFAAFNTTQGKDLVYNFYRALFDRNIANSATPLPYLIWIVIVVLLMHFTATKAHGEVTKRERRLYILYYILAALCYAVVVEIAMLTGFTDAEKVRLACFERYMGSFIIGCMVFPFELLFIEISQKNRLNYWSASVAIVVLLLMTNGYNLNIFAPVRAICDNLTERQIADNIEANTDSDDVVYVLLNDNGNPLLSINYYCEDAILSFDHISILGATFGDLDKDLTDSEIVTAEEEKIFSCDDLYVHDVTDAFNETFRSHNNGENFEPDTMYRLENGQVVEKWDY